MYFTSLELLEKSHADKGRVRKLSQYLAALQSPWNHWWLFPTYLVQVSNGFADYEWVKSEPSVLFATRFDDKLREIEKTTTHVNSQLTAYSNLFKELGINDINKDFDALTRLLKGEGGAEIAVLQEATSQPAQGPTVEQVVNLFGNLNQHDKALFLSRLSVDGITQADLLHSTEHEVAYRITVFAES